jgi:hypothetical protein
MSCTYSLQDRDFIRIGYFNFPALSKLVLMEGVQSDLATKRGVARKFSVGKTELPGQ